MLKIVKFILKPVRIMIEQVFGRLMILVIAVKIMTSNYPISTTKNLRNKDNKIKPMFAVRYSKSVSGNSKETLS